MRNSITIGITGGVGAGKSTVLSELRRKGAHIIDADKVGHEAYLPGTKCLEQLVSHFGEKILSGTGTVNRKALGEIVFKDEKEMKILNSIVWPAIKDLLKTKKREIIDSEADNYNPGGKILIVIEAAILVEAGWMDLMDEVWVISANTQTRIDRLMKRNSISEEIALKMINSQLADNERRKVADIVILNNGSSEALIEEVRKEIIEMNHRWNRNISHI